LEVDRAYRVSRIDDCRCIRRGCETKSEKKPPMPDRYSKLPAADLDALVAYMASVK
jgi:hypothetical protein